MAKNPPISEFSLSTRSLAGRTTEVLRQAILRGHFEPGQRLEQDAIAEELGVSRTPVREAIAALQSEGLLYARPHRGVFVTTVSKEDIRNLFDLRALLEAEVVRQAASHIPDTVIDELESLLVDAQRAYEDGDQVAPFDADRRLHETLLEFTENDLLKEVLDGINNRIRVVRGFAQMRPGPHVEEFTQEHFAIVGSLRQRDPEAVATLMKEHLKNSGARLQELVE
jgi:DNA-binding GntR family transcriptional regulator